MKHLEMDGHLKADGATDQKRAHQTFVGQAHFAGSGPAGRECRNCSLAKVEKQSPKDLSVQAVSWAQWRKLMRTTTVKSFSPRAQACKYFVEGEPIKRR